MIIKAKPLFNYICYQVSYVTLLKFLVSKDRTKLTFILKWNVFFSISFNCLLFALIASAISQLP